MLIQKCSLFLKEVVQLIKYLLDSNDHLVRHLL